MPAVPAERPADHAATEADLIDPVRTEHERRLRRVRKVAELLDDAFRVPVIGVRFGWDSLIGLAPGFGDVATAGLALWVVRQARLLGVPKRTLTRMVANVGLDAVTGVIPVVGDVADVAFKANRRNLKLIEQHVAEHGLPRHAESERRG